METSDNSSEKKLKKEQTRYSITVASTKRPTYTQYIATYGKGNVSGLWRERAYGLILHDCLRDVVPPLGDITLIIKYFDRAVTAKKAISWAEKRGCRPTFPWEREAFVKAYDGHYIVDIGSFTLDETGGICFPEIFEDGDGRCLFEWKEGSDESADIGFLFAIKETTSDQSVK